MTRPRLSRAARARAVAQERAEETERLTAGVERRLLGMERLLNRVLLVKTAYRNGKLSDARYGELSRRLHGEWLALKAEYAEQTREPGSRRP
ncbi:hypothetical protein [Caulobacter mirabilis]|uniref:Uncharacterized protein n=1 Tax=Caulobacter mirabilis TaxID=69666 RepID=A0A2D2AX78_9CAUL|nr:hypothetical protein [Caulobacter mirabilis]ATQ42602.1 hypothetical protein CSW64_09380 [Caulobacter mirabilis]